MLLSICIPAFNQAAELQRTLDSLEADSIARAIDQGLIEVLVSNNASTDETSALSHSLQSKRLTWFNQSENLGFRGNLGFLADRSTSEYIIFLGCGETIDERHINGLLELLQRKPWALGTVGLRYFDATRGVLSNPASNRVGDSLQKLAPKPLYTEAISGNIFSRDLFVKALGESNLTGDSWPHLEVSLRIGLSVSQTVVFRYSSPLVTVHGSSDGWWTRQDQWKLCLSHIGLLNSSGRMMRPTWVKVKLLEMMSIGLYGAIRQSSNILQGRLDVSHSELRLALRCNPVARATLLLLRIQGFLAIKPD